MKQSGLPPAPPPTWQPKYPEIRRLEDYSQIPDDSFWDSWPVNFSPLDSRESWISASALFELATSIDFHRPILLRWACDTLKEGADIGARGAGRASYKGENYSSSTQYGHLMVDGLADWLSKGLALGPFLPSDMPFGEFRVNPMSIVPKPSGAGRICIDLSAPHPRDYLGEGEEPVSVNASINKDEFKSAGVSTVDVLWMLQSFGPGVWFSKQDWYVTELQLPSN